MPRFPCSRFGPQKKLEIKAVQVVDFTGRKSRPVDRARMNALIAGDKTYFTGKPCKRGHIAPRRANGTCISCQKVHHATRYAEAPPGYFVEKARLRRHADPVRAAAQDRKYKRTPRARITQREKKGRRRARLQRCVCCTPEQFRRIYEAADWMACEVDHRIALALGGAHCTENLQLLSPAQHAAKTLIDLAAIRALRI